MKRHLNISDMEGAPPPKRYKTLRIRRPGKNQYYTRSVNRMNDSATIIARFWLKFKRNMPANRTDEETSIGHQRKNGKNVICCITQDKIPNELCFKFFSLITPHVHSYSVPDLVDYFKSSGNFRCPMTREEFSQPVVRRLSLKAFRLGIPAMNLTGIFAMRQQIMNRQIERDNRILAIENTCGLAMTECIDMCANFNVSTVVAAHELLNLLIPEWKQLVDDYARFSLNDCRTMVLADKDKMIRLHRSSVDNPHRLMKFVDDAIDGKLEQLNAMSGIDSGIGSFAMETETDDVLSFLNNLPPLPALPSFAAPILSNENARSSFDTHEETMAFLSNRLLTTLTRPLNELSNPPAQGRFTFRFSPPTDPDF